jgi:predicted NAD-dependent protein-ADP-ribosyltransferase YbiA (DUF1768 family)
MRIHKDKNIISFTKVKLPYGWMGNMIQCPIEYKGRKWFHTEGLFQALRFDETGEMDFSVSSNSGIMLEIQQEKNPMKA